MSRISSKSLIFSCIVSLLLLSSFSANTFASTRKKGPSSCSHLHVHLNGKKPAKRTCLDGQKSVNSVSEPDCGSSIVGIELILWWNANYSGGNICFSGTGSTDLGSYPKPLTAICLCTSWDKQASSYEMRDGSTRKTIYSGIGENGAETSAITFQDNLSHTPVGDDNASSINIALASASTK